MQLHVARQPIFNRRKSIVAYELLHRESPEACAYTAQDGDYATSCVITSAFLSYGLDVLADDTMAYINFTACLLVQGVPMLLPREQVVVEILETVEPTEEVLTACRALKAAGYTLALDDYVLQPGYDALVELADVIKVDFRANDAGQQQAIIERYRSRKLCFLVEKVETEAEFVHAMKLGYDLFQGYFFARPVTLSAKAVQPTKMAYVQLMQAIHEPSPDFGKIISAIESDVAFSLDTIKLVNSAYYARRNKLSSVKDAVVMLGMEGVRKWVNMSVLSRLARNKPDVLISHSLIRSTFLDLLARRAGQAGQSAEYALLGLFSLLDALTGCTFQSLLGCLNLSDTIKAILIRGDLSSPLGRTYALMLHYEQGEFDEAATLAAGLQLCMDDVAHIYVDALEWYSSTAAMSKAAREG